jgi:hypothetical protein
MALLKRELYRQVKGPDVTNADRWTTQRLARSLKDEIIAGVARAQTTQKGGTS